MNPLHKIIKPCLSGSMLKLIAIITMLIDHVAYYILSQIAFFTKPFLSLFGKSFSLYSCMRLIGRVAFPLYAFLLVEGFLHTKDRKKYGIRLFSFALISELPWNFAHTGTWFSPSQNVMFTLLFGYLALCALEYFEKDRLKQLLSLILLFLACYFGRIDYGIRGLGLILVMYFLRKNPVAQAITSSCMLNDSLAASVAFIPINLYNGERGFMRGTLGKYIGYWFYPVHLFLLGVLRYWILSL